MTYKKNKKREEKLYYVHEREGEECREITKIYGKSCFHVAHEAALVCTSVPSDSNDE